MIMYPVFSWRRDYILNNTFVIKVIDFILFLITSLKPISIEVILRGGAISISGSRFKMLIIWLNLEKVIRKVEVLCV